MGFKTWIRRLLLFPVFSKIKVKFVCVEELHSICKIIANCLYFYIDDLAKQNICEKKEKTEIKRTSTLRQIRLDLYWYRYMKPLNRCTIGTEQENSVPDHRFKIMVYTFHWWTQGSFNYKRVWATVSTLAQCGLTSSHLPHDGFLNCKACDKF